MRPILITVACTLFSLLLWGLFTRRWSRQSRAARSRERELRGSAAAHPLLTIPVPWVFVLAYLIGVGIQRLAPPTFLTPASLSLARWIGLAPLAIGLLFAFTALGLFKKSRTTTIPFDTPTLLVLRGPYRFTRNPMYLGLTLIYLGVAASQGQLWPLAVLPLVILYLNQVVIPLEERSLHEIFGDQYDRYRAQSSRCWLFLSTPPAIGSRRGVPYPKP